MELDVELQSPKYFATILYKKNVYFFTLEKTSTAGTLENNLTKKRVALFFQKNIH